MKLWRIGFVFLLGPSLVFAASGKEAVRRVVRKNLKDVRGCYELMLERRDLIGERSGKVVVEWTVDSSGKASKIAVIDEKTTLKNTELHSCIIGKLESWKFPKTPGKKIVLITGYPFIFQENLKKK